MACQNTNKGCNCEFNLKAFGLCDPRRVILDGKDRTTLNWSEISVPEILCIPETKPDIEILDQIYATAELTSVKLIETPFAYEIVNRLADQDELNDLGVIYNAINVGAASIVTLTSALATAVAALIAGIPAINITPAVQALINTVNAAVTAVNTALAAVVSASADALGLINDGITEALATAVCEVLVSVSELLDALIASITNLLLAVNALVNSLVGIIDLTTLLTGVTNAEEALTDAIDAVIALINNLLALLGNTSYLVITPNEEGTCLTGRKLVIQGFLNQKVVYTGDVSVQSVHSAHYSVPFSAFIVVYAKFEGLTFTQDELIRTLESPTTPIPVSGFGYNCTFDINENLIVDLCEEFCVDVYVEDIFANELDERTVFKNVTLFLSARPSKLC